MPASGFHFTHQGLNRGEGDLGFYGRRTASDTPGPGHYEPNPYLSDPVKRTFAPSYVPERNRQENAEPFSLSRSKGQQILVDYAAADFWDLHKGQDAPPYDEFRVKRSESLPSSAFCRARGPAQARSVMGWRGERHVDFRMMQAPDYKFSPLSDHAMEDKEAEVRSVHALEEPSEPHENVLHNLRNHAQKIYKEARGFIRNYREADVPSQSDEERLNALIKTAGTHKDDLASKSAKLQGEAEEAAHKLKTLKSKSVPFASKKQLDAMNSFERMQKRTLEDKMSAELQRSREEAQMLYSAIVKKLNQSLKELQDFRTLHRELQKLKIDKLSGALRQLVDGRLIRACLRGLIGCGADKMSQRLEVLPVKLEPWMREVLINSAYLEIKVEEGEARIASLRHHKLSASMPALQELRLHTNQERVESLRMQHHRGSHTEALEHKLREEQEAQRIANLCIAPAIAWDDPPPPIPISENGSRPVSRQSCRASTLMIKEVDHVTTMRRVPEEDIKDIQEVHDEIKAHRQLLGDMKKNVAASISNQILRAKGRSREKGRQAMLEGMQVLACLTSEDFAKTAMKEMQKSEEKDLQTFKSVKTIRLNGPQLREFRNLASSFQQIASAHTAMQSRQSGTSRPASRG